MRQVYQCCYFHNLKQFPNPIIAMHYAVTLYCNPTFPYMDSRLIYTVVER